MYAINAQKFINKWEGIEFESSTTLTPEFKSFNAGFKKLMNNIWDVHQKSFKANHFCTSGFIQLWDDFVYVSISDVRHFSDDWKFKVLYRKATGPTDFSGGSNNYCHLMDLKEKIHTLIY